MVDLWWAQQFKKCGGQDFVSVLMGELGGRLRLGKKGRADPDRDHSGHGIV